MRALRLALVGEFAAAADQARRGRHLAERVGDISMLGMYFAFQTQFALLRGTADEGLDEALALIEQAPDIPLITVSRAQIRLAQGYRDVAETIITPLRDLPVRMPKGPRWSATIGILGLLAVDLGDADLAERCYRLSCPPPSGAWVTAAAPPTPWARSSGRSASWPVAPASGMPPSAISTVRWT